jgi:hypothetical protein
MSELKSIFVNTKEYEWEREDEKVLTLEPY